MLSTDKQTNKQTNQRYQKHNLLCQGGNETDYRFSTKPHTHWQLWMGNTAIQMDPVLLYNLIF